MMTDAVIDAILRTVELGIWPDRAAQMHGVSSSTMRAYRRRNPEFATALEKAEARAESSLHGKILRHIDKQWTAAAWILERRWPERYARPEIRAQITATNVDTAELAKAIANSLEHVAKAHADFNRRAPEPPTFEEPAS